MWDRVRQIWNTPIFTVGDKESIEVGQLVLELEAVLIRPRARDLAVLHPDIAAERRHPRTIDNQAVLDQQVVSHLAPLSFARA